MKRTIGMFLVIMLISQTILTSLGLSQEMQAEGAGRI